MTTTESGRCTWCKKGILTGDFCSEECRIAWDYKQEKAQESETVKPYTVVGRYPGGKPVVVHVTCDNSMDARRCAVQHIAFSVYQGNIPEGLQPMNDAIRNVDADFELVMVLEGHAAPAPDHRAGSFIFHGHPETEDGDFHRNVSNERTDP